MQLFPWQKEWYFPLPRTQTAYTWFSHQDNHVAALPGVVQRSQYLFVTHHKIIIFLPQQKFL